MPKPKLYEARLMIKLSNKDLEAMKQYCKDKDLTMSDFIRTLYTKKLKREKYL